MKIDSSPIQGLLIGGLSFACFTACFTGGVHAEFQNNFDNEASDSNYYNATNWNVLGQNFLPSASLGDEVAVIGSSALPTATVNLTTALTDGDRPGGLILGASAAHQGTLTIASGGVMEAIPGATAPGTIVVGGSGTGVLNLNGGTLRAVSLSSGGNASSALNLSGAAIVEVGAATLRRTTSFFDTTASFGVSGGLTLVGEHTLNTLVNGSTAPLFSVGGAASLGGVLTVDLSAASGDSWTLFDAGSISGGFSTVTSTDGASVGFRVIDGGVHGKLGQLYLERLLTLTVNRDSGGLSITNPNNEAISIDAYTVVSPTQLLDSTNGVWNSFEDQGLSSWHESSQPVGGKTDRISELKLSGYQAVSGAGLSLGSVFKPTLPSRFGAEVNYDLTFQYRTAQGEIKEGQVEYVGTAGINNLVLSVDPASGSVVLKNTSSFSVGLDGYTIYSESGANSLRTNNSSWTSLDDQNGGGGDWDESSSPAGGLVKRLGELKLDGFAVLAPGEQFNLGTPFQAGSVEDLVLEYRIDGARYSGDFNDDGNVDAADYTVWRDNLSGDFSANDYQAWKSNYGGAVQAEFVMRGEVVYASSAAASISVPEPSGLGIAASIMAWSAKRIRRRK